MAHDSEENSRVNPCVYGSARSAGQKQVDTIPSHQPAGIVTNSLNMAGFLLGAYHPAVLP